MTGQRILVVDDEPRMAAALADILRMGGYEVDTATSGAEALDRLDRQPYAAVLTDVRMPHLDGPGLFREIERRHPTLRDRVVFITGDTARAELREFLGESRVPIIEKPIRIDEVLQVVERLLGGKIR
jgi:CheY-like chemotaxis protein